MEELKLSHYGVEVKYFEGESGSFLYNLRNRGITFTHLPFADPHVVKYSIDGNAEYAVIVPFDGIEGRFESVYVTSCIPDDCNWFLLISDISNQLRFSDSKPLQLPSRLAVMLDLAFKKSEDALAKEYTIPNPDRFFDDDDEFIVDIPKDVLLKAVIAYLNHYGITRDALIESMGTHDVSDKRIMELADAWEARL